MRNIKLLIEYDGTDYHGWQVQPNGRTVQEVLEEKIGIMTRQRVRLIGSGRTDAGVHALGQVANFKTSSAIPPEGFRAGLNSLLPPDIVILEASEAEEAFHAQYWARRKTYRYRILTRQAPSAIHRNFSWHLPRPLDLAAMRRAAEILLGRHDFTSFRGADTDTLNPERKVFRAAWGTKEDFLHFTIEADGFLKHMVRNIVGTLVDVGQGKSDPEAFRKILAGRDRRRAGITAPPQGLFLLEVAY